MKPNLYMKSIILALTSLSSFYSLNLKSKNSLNQQPNFWFTADNVTNFITVNGVNINLSTTVNRDKWDAADGLFVPLKGGDVIEINATNWGGNSTSKEAILATISYHDGATERVIHTDEKWE